MTGSNALARSIPFVAIMGASAYFYYLADNLDFGASPGRAGPDLWPKIVLGLMIATCVIGVAKSFIRSSGAASLFTLLAPQGAEDGESTRTRPHLALAGIALFVAYVLLLDRVGFVICTAVLIAAFLFVGRYRNLAVIAAASLVGSLGFFFIFRRLVYVSLPLGKEPFLSFSVWLMKMMGMS
jgi:putative tricarboxylic transport membrane protein